MLIACGRPQGRWGDPAHVDACGQGRGQEPDFFCGRHKWMTPYVWLLLGLILLLAVRHINTVNPRLFQHGLNVERTIG